MRSIYLPTVTAHAHFMFENTSFELAERNAAADYLALHICVYRLSNWRLRVAAAKIPALGTITDQADTCVVPGDLSSAGCGSLEPSIPHFRLSENWLCSRRRFLFSALWPRKVLEYRRSEVRSQQKRASLHSRFRIGSRTERGFLHLKGPPARSCHDHCDHLTLPHDAEIHPSG